MTNQDFTTSSYKQNINPTTNASRYVNNLEVLRNLKNHSAPETLKLYTGWGGLRKEIYNPTIYKQLLQILTREEIDSLKKTLTSAYYTPTEIVKFIYQWLLEHKFTGGAILEPAIGNGVFVEHMSQEIKNNSVVDAVEIDKVTSEITQKLHPQIKLTTCGFEAYNPDKKYDLIIGNPPYGSNQVEDVKHPDLNEYCIHHYFVAKSMRLLKQGGILAMVLPSYFLDNMTKHVRQIIKNEGGNLLDAYRLPDDLFQDAKVTIDIVFLTKGYTNNKWLYSRKVKINNYHMPLNEFYIQHPEKVLGTFEVVDMYERKGLTCKRNTDDIFTLLHSKLNQISKPNFEQTILERLKKVEFEIQDIMQCLAVH